jgi:hypothetical protein
MKCEKCGNENAQGSKYCNKCGNNLNNNKQSLKELDDGNQNIIDTSNTPKKAKAKKVSIGTIIIFSILLFAGIKLYDYLSIPKSFTGKELNDKITEYALDLKNGDSDDELEKQLYNSGETEVNATIVGMIENAITAENYKLVYYWADTYVSIFKPSDQQVFSSIMDYSKNFYDYSNWVKEYQDKYGDIQLVYYNPSHYINREFYITQVIGYADNLLGTLNELADQFKQGDIKYYVAYDVENNQFGDKPGDIPYLIVSEYKIPQTGVYQMNVLEFGTNTLELENGFEKEVTVFKHVTDDYYDKLDDDFSSYQTMKAELEENSNKILKLINPNKYNISEQNKENDNSETVYESTNEPKEENTINSSVNETTIVKDSDEGENIDDYLSAAWYVTEYGMPEFDDEGNAVSPGIRIFIENDGIDYWIDVLGVFGNGVCSSFYIMLEKEGNAWVGHYDEDGWGNSGQMALYLENGVPYITISALGGDIDNGLNIIYKPCTQIK